MILSKPAQRQVKWFCCALALAEAMCADTARGHSPGAKPHWLIQEIQESGNSDDQFFQFMDGSDGTATIPVFWSPTLSRRKQAHPDWARKFM